MKQQLCYFKGYVLYMDAFLLNIFYMDANSHTHTAHQPLSTVHASKGTQVPYEVPPGVMLINNGS